MLGDVFLPGALIKAIHPENLKQESNWYMFCPLIECYKQIKTVRNKKVAYIKIPMMAKVYFDSLIQEGNAQQKQLIKLVFFQD